MNVATNVAMNVAVKGWCPGALRPMRSGDGLIVRVRPWCGAFSLTQALGLADAAERFGNGHIDLTRRANLQIRGVCDTTLPDLQAELDSLGLLDADAESEAVRNVMVGPFAGPPTRALAEALTDALLADRRLVTLPAKFGWTVDDGTRPSILDQRSDVALCLMEEGVAVRRREVWLGVVARDRAVAAAIAIARGEEPTLAPLDRVPAAGARPMGVAAPFGRIEAFQLRGVAEAARKAGATEIRLSPWRALYLDAPTQGLEKLGLIVDADDPLLRIEACPGAPACASSSVDTRRDARRLAAAPFKGTIHVSGCTKGCARSMPADLVLVGSGGRYGVIHNGTTRDRFERTISPEEL